MHNGQGTVGSVNKNEIITAKNLVTVPLYKDNQVKS